MVAAVDIDELPVAVGIEALVVCVRQRIMFAFGISYGAFDVTVDRRDLLAFTVCTHRDKRSTIPEHVPVGGDSCRYKDFGVR